jgi:hypothetical protein
MGTTCLARVRARGRGALTLALAVLDRLSRGALGRLGDLPFGVFFVRCRDRADRVAVEIDPRCAGLERLQMGSRQRQVGLG